jgi:hypothetical protein
LMKQVKKSGRVVGTVGNSAGVIQVTVGKLRCCG